MPTSKTNLSYTQQIRRFQQQHVEYFSEKVIFELKRTEHRCPKCGDSDVSAEWIGDYCIRTTPMGACREI